MSCLQQLHPLPGLSPGWEPLATPVPTVSPSPQLFYTLWPDPALCVQGVGAVGWIRGIEGRYHGGNMAGFEPASAGCKSWL